jgi:hypothetical protein
MQQYYYKRNRQKREFLLPFLILICLGIIVILVVKLILAFVNDNSENLDNKVTLYLEGDKNAQILPEDQSGWVKAYDGSALFPGDSVKTGAQTKAILIFNDTNVLRLDQNSQLVLTDLTKNDSALNVLVEFSYGEIWIKKNSFDGDFIVKTKHAKIYSLGTTFAIEDRSYEILRVMGGNVQFDIFDEKDEERDIPLESYVAGVGQQITLTEKSYEAIVARSVVDIKTAISNEWEATEWYIWNIKEDKEPTDFAALIKENKNVNDSSATTDNTITNNNQYDQIPADIINVDQNPVSEPKESEIITLKEKPVVFITKPSQSPYTLNEEKYMIQGTIKGYATQVIVESVTGDGIKDKYTLSKFKAGDTSWSYLAYKNYKNISEGSNIYKIYAKDQNGIASEAVQVLIQVPEGAFVTETENTETEQSNNVALEAPVVLSFNGTSNTNNNYETTEDRVEIIGMVDKSVQKVVVNGFVLTLFEAASSSWKYYAKTEYNTLKIGENNYSVYGVDANGNKTPSVTFVIVKK